MITTQEEFQQMKDDKLRLIISAYKQKLCEMQKRIDALETENAYLRESTENKIHSNF